MDLCRSAAVMKKAQFHLETSSLKSNIVLCWHWSASSGLPVVFLALSPGPVSRSEHADTHLLATLKLCVGDSCLELPYNVKQSLM